MHSFWGLTAQKIASEKQAVKNRWILTKKQREKEVMMPSTLQGKKNPNLAVPAVSYYYLALWLTSHIERWDRIAVLRW